VSVGLGSLSIPDLRALAHSLRSGPLSVGVTPGNLRQLLGDGAVPAEAVLQRFTAEGMTARQMALALDLLAEARDQAFDPGRCLELVLSGPEVPSVPASDTRATMESLIECARRELFLVGYAVHNGALLFESIGRRLAAEPGLQVVLCLDVARQPNDTSLDGEIVRRFAADFKAKHWPWPQRPKLYYDPRALSPNSAERASLHAKCVIADGAAALITSANFTEAAQRRNLEAGLLLRHPPLVLRLRAYFEAAIRTGWLVECHL